MPRTKHSSRETLKILLMLIYKDGCYGYQLAKDLDILETTTYGILKRLSKDGYVKPYWDVSGVEKPRLMPTPSYLLDDAHEDTIDEETKNKRGGARQCYQITPAGSKFTLELQRKFGKSKKKNTAKVLP
jgi:DNA-binding PadR family transcriptional regulator